MGKRGSERPEEMGNSYFLRLANIKDSTELYAGIKMDNPGLVVDFVSPVTFGQASFLTKINTSHHLNS